MKPETKFAIKVDKDLKALPNAHFFNIQQVAIRGTPDRLGVVAGHFVALELKATKDSPRSKLQEYQIEKLKKSGAVAHFVWPEIWPDVYEELKRL